MTETLEAIDLDRDGAAPNEKEMPPANGDRIVRALRRSSRRAVDDVQKLTKGIALGVVSTFSLSYSS